MIFAQFYIPLILFLVAIAREFDEIKSLYNQGRAADIYAMWCDDSKAQLDEATFVAQLDQMRSNSGNIVYYVDQSTTQKQSYSVGFEINLNAGVLQWTTNEQDEIVTFIMYDGGLPSMVDYMQANPDKASFTIRSNDQVLLDYNGDRFAPLASVLKIPIACEFARQVSLNMIDPEKRITLTQLNRFYMLNFDGAHQMFLEYKQNQGKLINDTVSLYDIAEGMIMFSSNCNTEFMQTILGMSNIDAMIDELGLEYSNTTYLVSSILSLMNFERLPHDEYIQQIKTMPFEKLRERHLKIHDALYDNMAYGQWMLANAYHDLLDKDILERFPDYLPYSNTNSHARVLQKLNLRQYAQFNDVFYTNYYNILGTLTMMNSVALKQFSHAGFKGGSANFPGDDNCVLNTAYFDQFKSEIIPNLSRSFVFFLAKMDNDVYSQLLNQLVMFKDLLSFSADYYLAVAQRLRLDNMKQ